MAHRFRTIDKTTPAAKARIARYNTAEHNQAKEQFRKDIAAGRGTCWRCRQPIPAGSRCGPDWQTGHDDLGLRIMGPEHTLCNRRAGASKGGKVALSNATMGVAACSECGRTFVKRKLAQRFCSPHCRDTCLARKPKPARPSKVARPAKPAPALHPCPLCTTATTRKVYCSQACMLEANARQARNKYRASVGLPPDDRPRKPHQEPFTRTAW